MTVSERVTHVTSTFLDSYNSHCKEIFLASHLEEDITHLKWLRPKLKNEMSGHACRGNHKYTQIEAA